MSDSSGGSGASKVVAEAPNLQALLNSNTNSSSSSSSGIGDNLIPVELGNNGNSVASTNNSSSSNSSSGAGSGGGGSLPEGLVSGQPINNSPSSGAGSSAPSPVTTRTNSAADSSNEITLAALLSKPPVQNMSPLAVAASPSSTSQMGSPTKASPLIQQLQQPIPPPRTPLPLPPSPRQQPQASPRITSPRPPPMQVPSSPQQQATVVRSSSLQQQLMQPPKSQSLVSVPLPVQDINNLHNGNGSGVSGNAVTPSGTVAHNGGGAGGGGTATGGNGNMVSLQTLMQGGMAVQVSQHQQTSNSIPVQLNIPGLSAPVTLSLNVPDQQQPNHVQQPQVQQPQVAPKMVPTSTVVTLATTSTSGTVLIPQGPNIIQLPQQPAASVISPSIATMRTPTGQTVQLHAANANNILKGAQVVQVRGQHGGQPLYVQMPVTSAAAASVGQSIQIVRSVDQPTVAVRQQQFSSPVQQPQQQIVLNSVKGSQPSLITLSPQQQQQQQLSGGQPQQVVLQANNTVLQQSTAGSGGAGGNGSAGGQNSAGGAGARQVAIQLQEQQQPGVAVQPGLMTQAKVVQNQAGVNQRMRQHRKQSLK